MARDIALMERARVTGEAVFSIYEWACPTLSLGRNQTARGRYDRSCARAMGIDFVRRPTGGRALLHNREVTYSVTAPVEPGAGLSAWFGRINGILQSALRSLGVDVEEAAPKAKAAAPDHQPCFTEPARGELTWNGRKLVGSAQWRENGALLQHGSILMDDDQHLIQDLTGSDTTDSTSGANGNATAALPQQLSAAATLRLALGRDPSVAEVGSALFGAVQQREDIRASSLRSSEIRDATLGLISHFEDDRWTWRR